MGITPLDFAEYLSNPDRVACSQLDAGQLLPTAAAEHPGACCPPDLPACDAISITNAVTGQVRAILMRSKFFGRLTATVVVVLAGERCGDAHRMG